MPAARGITKKGKPTEKRFCALTGATLSDTAGKGDALLDDHYIEIKHMGSTSACQIRAMKWIPLVCFYAPESQWYVLAPHDIVELLRGRQRGQHGENPFESAVLSLGRLSGYEVDEADLTDVVRGAIAAGDDEDHAELRAEMDALYAESRQMIARHRREVHRILDGRPRATVGPERIRTGPLLGVPTRSTGMECGARRHAGPAL